MDSMPPATIVSASPARISAAASIVSANGARRDQVRHFGGTYRHRLVRTPDGLRIRLQRVDMMNGQAAYDYVLQAWV